MPTRTMPAGHAPHPHSCCAQARRPSTSTSTPPPHTSDHQVMAPAIVPLAARTRSMARRISEISESSSPSRSRQGSSESVPWMDPTLSASPAPVTEPPSLSRASSQASSSNTPIDSAPSRPARRSLTRSASTASSGSSPARPPSRTARPGSRAGLRGSRAQPSCVAQAAPPAPTEAPGPALVPAPAAARPTPLAALSTSAPPRKAAPAPTRIPSRRIGTRRNPVPPTPATAGMKRKLKDEEAERKRPRIEPAEPAVPPVPVLSLMAPTESANDVDVVPTASLEPSPTEQQHTPMDVDPKLPTVQPPPTIAADAGPSHPVQPTPSTPTASSFTNVTPTAFSGPPGPSTPQSPLSRVRRASHPTAIAAESESGSALSARTPPGTLPRSISFADRILAVGREVTHSPGARPPLTITIPSGPFPLAFSFPARPGPRRSRPGEDDPFFVRKPPPMPSPGSRPPMPPPPMICVFDPDDVVISRVEPEQTGPIDLPEVNVEKAEADKDSGTIEPPPGAMDLDAPSHDVSTGPTVEAMDIDELPAPPSETAAVICSTLSKSSGLPCRRPSAQCGPSRPTDTARKMSYPSSLGSGPLRHQTARVVSNPMANTIFEDPMDVQAPSLHSVSVPTRPARTPPPSRPNSRMSMSMSTQHEDTSRTIAGLTDVLARLRAASQPRVAKRPVTTAPVVLEDASARKFVSAPARLKNTTTRTLGEKNSNTGSLAHILSSTYGTFLKGVVAYVDVWTAEGDEAGGTFVEMLKRCGARVLVKKPTEACTHIIYKTGRPATANFVRRLDADKRPKVVGIKWVKMCAELGTWVPEDEHLVNLDAEDIFIPKKKSMQPKPMRCLGSGAIGLGEARINVPLAARHPGVRVANPRNMYAPKVGSPLKKSYVHQDENS